MPKVPPRNTKTFSTSKAASDRVIRPTAAISRLRLSAICMKGTMTWAQMKAGAPMIKPRR